MIVTRWVFGCVLGTAVVLGVAYMLIASAWYGCRVPFAIGWTIVLTSLAAIGVALIWDCPEGGNNG